MMADIERRAKEFAKVYVAEKEALLEVLTEGDQTLYAMAAEIVRSNGGVRGASETSVTLYAVVSRRR